MNKKIENENKTKEDIKKSKNTNMNKSNTIENSQNNEEQELLDIKTTMYSNEHLDIKVTKK